MKKKLALFMVFALAFFAMGPVYASDVNPLGTVTCGSGAMQFPAVIPNLTALLVKFARYVVPALLIIYGMYDFAKAVIANDEKETKTAQKNFTRRAAIAVILYLSVSIISWVFALISSRSNGSIDGNDISDCINCFLNGSDSRYCGRTNGTVDPIDDSISNSQGDTTNGSSGNQTGQSGKPCYGDWCEDIK